MSTKANDKSGLTGAQKNGRLLLCFALLSTCLWASTPASAGMVSGVVRENGQNLRDARIELKDSMNNRFVVTTDGSGRYSANLPPGIYRARKFNDKRKRALIQSSPQSSEQNIDFGGR
jgi:hypothetical protein